MFAGRIRTSLTALAVIGAGAGLALVAPTAATAVPLPMATATCNGLAATIVGTEGSDDIEGTAGIDTEADQ